MHDNFSLKLFRTYASYTSMPLPRTDKIFLHNERISDVGNYSMSRNQIHFFDKIN